VKVSFFIILVADSSYSVIRSIRLNDAGLGRVIVVEYRTRAKGRFEDIKCFLGRRGPKELLVLLEPSC